MRTLLLTTATATLIAGLAVAQDATSTDDTLLPQDGTEAEATETPTEESTAPEVAQAGGDTINQSDGGNPQYGAFADTAVRDLVGKNVLAMDGQNVGEVENLILDGEAVEAIVGVGGFLGFGEHDVAIPLKDFVDTEAGLMLPAATKEDLEGMAAFEGDNEILPMDVTVSGEPAAMEEILPDATGGEVGSGTN